MKSNPRAALPSSPAAATLAEPGCGRALVRGLLVAAWVGIALACGPSIEEEEPVPEHRIAPCEAWCSMILDPSCPAGATVESMEACNESCTHNDVVWGEDDREDVCRDTYTEWIECFTALSCEERQRHWELMNDVPQAERSSCGEIQQEQFDCQIPYQ